MTDPPIHEKQYNRTIYITAFVVSEAFRQWTSRGLPKGNHINHVIGVSDLISSISTDGVLGLDRIGLEMFESISNVCHERLAS